MAIQSWVSAAQRRRLLLVGLCGAVVLVIVLCLVIPGAEQPAGPYVLNSKIKAPSSEGEFESSNNRGPDGRGWGAVGRSDSVLGSYEYAGISSDGVPCANIARQILTQGGTAADAAIAGLFCGGVVNSQSMGLGGGFLLTYYHRANNTAFALDAREVAPLAATQNMYSGDAERSRRGGLAVGVPGEVRGYYELYRQFGGGMAWRDLIQPTVDLCIQGHHVNWHMARALRTHADIILNEPSMQVFVNPSTGQVYQRGEVLKRPQLAATLRAIQADPDALYTGPLAARLVEDLGRLGGIITGEDLRTYRPKWRTPISVSLGPFTFHSVPPPGSGPLLAFILNIIDAVGTRGDGSASYQQLVEAFKFAYARRGEMGDEDFVDMAELIEELTSEEHASRISRLLSTVYTKEDLKFYGVANPPPPEDHGTAQFSLLAPNGDAVSVTSTVNLYFGAAIRSVQTGIVLNDEMDDFSSPNITNYFGMPPSHSNFISPGKRPLSSMSPSILVDAASGAVRLVLGAAGGTKIPSGIANVIYHHLWGSKDIKQAVDARRLHHQIFPMHLMYETGFNQTVLKRLESKGHKMQEFSVGGSVVCAVAAHDGKVFANSDFRKSGQVDGI